MKKLRRWWAASFRRHETVAGHVPEDMRQYVNSIEYWQIGASLDLTRAGIDFVRKAPAGVETLTRLVMGQDGWQGDRSEQDVGREIKAHCDAWFWLPPLRGRANPIDLEFFRSWPINLLVSLHLLSGNRPRS